jgi:hypothetical protein
MLFLGLPLLSVEALELETGFKKRFHGWMIAEMRRNGQGGGAPMRGP